MILRHATMVNKCIKSVNCFNLYRYRGQHIPLPQRITGESYTVPYTIDTRIHNGLETQYILRLRARYGHIIYGNITVQTAVVLNAN